MNLEFLKRKKIFTVTYSKGDNKNHAKEEIKASDIAIAYAKASKHAEIMSKVSKTDKIEIDKLEAS